jgi:hypothetical protein
MDIFGGSMDFIKSKPDLESEKPVYGSLRFTVSHVENALLELDRCEAQVLMVSCHFVSSSTDYWHHVSFSIGDNSHLIFIAKNGRYNDILNYTIDQTWFS